MVALVGCVMIDLLHNNTMCFRIIALPLWCHSPEEILTKRKPKNLLTLFGFNVAVQDTVGTGTDFKKAEGNNLDLIDT